jgi:large subunit ribosomal protein L32
LTCRDRPDNLEDSTCRPLPPVRAREPFREILPMAVPKRKHSNSRTGKRRSHHGMKPKQLQSCPKCGTPQPTHVVCPNCGQYMGRNMVETEE